MAVHPLETVTELRRIATGSGGKTLVVSGVKGEAFFAGLQRPPARTLLESVLTFVAGAVYDEIVLIAGRAALPALQFGGLVQLGTSRAIVYLKRRPTVAQPAAPRTGLNRFGLSPRPTSGNSADANQIEADAQNMNWRDRLPTMFDRLENWCGVDHLGNRRLDIGAAQDVRRLILMDAEFLIPDRALWASEFSHAQSEAGHLPARFARLPTNIAGTRNDLILLTRDESEGSSVEAGSLIYRNLPEDASKFSQFSFKWEGVPYMTMLARCAGQAFAEYYPQPESLPYTHFRTVEPVNPSISRILPLERITAEELFRRMRREVIGQDPALRIIAETITRNIANRSADEKKPIASFLLPGPTGTGKTQTTIALAKALFGRTEDHLHVVDGGGELKMTSVHLLGMPAGYVGFTDDKQRNGGGLLTRPLIGSPNKAAVLVIDELGRAHPETPDLLFQALDKGWARDGSSGHIVSFRNTIMLFTTNLKSPDVENAFIALGDSGASWETLVARAPDFLNQDRPDTWSWPFLGRFQDCILPLFHPKPEHLLEIARKTVSDVLEQRHHAATISEAFLRLACAEYDRKLGIRHLEAKIKGRLDEQLAVFNRSGRTGLWLSVNDDGLIHESEKENAELTAAGASS